MAEPLIELAPELEPVAEASGAALTQIGEAAILVVVLGIILAVDAIVRGFFGTLKGAVGWIPWFGKVVEAPIDHIKQKVVSFLAGLAQDIQHNIAHSIHVAALDVRRAIHSIEDIAVAVILLGALAAGAVATYVIPSIKRLINTVVRKVEALTHTVIHRITKIERVTKTIFVHQVFPQLRTIEHRVEDLLRNDIREIRAEAKQAERIAIRTEKQIRHLNRLLSKKHLLALVAGAIGATALEAIRCTNFGNLFKKRGCNLWNDLENLLGLAVIPLAIASLDELIAIAQTVTEDVTKGVEDLLKV